MTRILRDEDLVLLRRELAAYGVAYSDKEDALVVGKCFMRDAGLIDTCLHYISPSCAVVLLKDPRSRKFVGAKFTWLTYLVAEYWNGVIKPFYSPAHIADIATFCAADKNSIVHDMGPRKQDMVRAMHRKAHELAQQIPALPAPIIERILETPARPKRATH
ncbi:MAG TPA: hypothetical protein VGB97_04690 [Candidatus Paceibacterota bacterium]